MEHSFMKKFGLLLVLGIGGLVAYRLLLMDVAPRASLDLAFDRNEIMEKASAYLAGLGYDLKDYQQDAWLQFDGESQLFLQTRGTMRQANESVRADTLSTHSWAVTWYNRKVSRSQNLETFQVWMSPGGRVLGFDHVINDSVGRSSLSESEARGLAEEFLSAHGVSLAAYNLRNSSESKLVNRVDYRFVWAKPDTAAESSIWVRIQGKEVGGYRLNFQPGSAFSQRSAEISTVATFFGTASFAVVFLLFFFIVILFLKKYHEGEVGTKTALMVFIGLFAVAFFQTTNIYPSIGSTTMVGDLNKANVRIVVYVMDVFIIQVFLSVLVFAAWSVGESSSRSAWPAKLTSADSALFRKFFTVDLAESVVRGYGWGGILIGGYAVILYFMMSFVHVRVLERSTGDIPESFFPFLQPILSGLYAGAFSEIIFRLFFISYLKERTKKVWTGVVISSMLWTAAGFAMWDRPFGFLSLSWAFVVLFLFGLVFSFLFLRYDLVTAMAANVVLTACSAAVPLFTSEAHTFVVSRWLFIGVMAVPVVVAGIGFIRRERFVFTLETMPRHIQRISERERMAKELEIARSVQMSLLPKMNPSLAGYDIGGICVPAREVGGDYYDFVNLGGRRVGIAVGDVSGKGVPAAIYMTLTKGILQSHAEENVSPKAVLSKVNSLMYRTIERNSFVSMFYAILDLDRKTIRFSRAGQCPVIMTQSAGAPGSFLTPKGMALGLEMGRVFDSVLEELELKLNSGEVLVFYTDGFTEAMNDSNEEFGEERLAASVARHRHLPANEMIRCICDDVNRFAGNRLQHDDMTMVVVKVG